MMSPKEKYHNDPQYKTLVDMMLSSIRSSQYTPSEMREAAIFASILYEERRPWAYRGKIDNWALTNARIDSAFSTINNFLNGTDIMDGVLYYYPDEDKLYTVKELEKFFNKRIDKLVEINVVGIEEDIKHIMGMSRKEMELMQSETDIDHKYFRDERSSYYKLFNARLKGLKEHRDKLKAGGVEFVPLKPKIVD